MVKNIESEDFMSWECLNRNIKKTKQSYPRRPFE